MSTSFGEKALACLRIAELRSASHDAATWEEARALYEAACQRWSQKAVDRMFESLAERNYVEYGVSARTGWLTAKGREALK